MISYPDSIARIRRTFLMWRQAGPKTAEGRALFRLLGGLLQQECTGYEDLLHVIAIWLHDLTARDLKRAYARAATLETSPPITTATP